MRATLIAVGTVVTLLGTASTPASAQGSGFWASFGLGYGSANSFCDDCIGGPRLNGSTAEVRVGGTPSRFVRVGVGLDGWSHTSSGTDETMGNLSALLYYYPRGIRSGPFVAGGLGYSDYFVNTEPTVSGAGWGLTVQVGDDFRVGRNIALTPSVTYGYGDVGELDSGAGGGIYTTGWTQNFVAVGLAVTFFSGRGGRR